MQVRTVYGNTQIFPASDMATVIMIVDIIIYTILFW